MQTAIADYRDQFIALLNERLHGRLLVLVGSHYFDPSIRTSRKVLSLPCVQRARNIFLFGGKLGFQLGNWGQILSADVVVFEMNPRLLSNWPLMGMRCLAGKRNVLWGHAWSRVGRISRTEILRAAMRRLATGLLFYTETQRREFIERYPKWSVDLTHVATNALYLRAQMVTPEYGGTDFIYVGRLVADKKPDLMIRGFAAAVSRVSGDVCLHVVGSGTEESRLKDLATELRVADRVRFHGHVADASSLSHLYGRSIASISPGYVGLSITQSFSFGRPMIVARDENHSPEIEAFREGFSGVYFASDSTESLANAIVGVCEHQYEWAARFDEIRADCAARYSVETMVEGFLRAVER